jgi:GT2 family glycosyltransferase
VAFNDDDSWWEPGALGAAVRLLDAHPRLGLLAARVVVGPACAPDPVCQAMAESPLAPDARLPGVPVLGFLACGAVVRRDAFLAVGGFEARFGIGGEEQLLALDLAAAGWGLAYVDGLVVHHHPSPVRDVRARRRREHRNALWTAWLRRPRRRAVSRTAALAGGGLRDGARRGALMDAVRGLPWILVARRPVPAGVERAVRQLER